ncbi:family 20 glycosylhydrolase [Microbacterium sp. MC2]
MTVPVPRSLTTVPAAAFALTSGTVIAGESDAGAVLSDLLRIRTALAPASSDNGPGDGDGAITLRTTGSGTPESYRIAVSEHRVTVTGADAAGLFYGVHTLVQLIERAGEGWIIPAVEIDDAPRFAYRGVMLDVARHFHPVETVKAYIDRAASLKFNHLHLHLTDDQGWRLHVASRPLLTERSSASSVGGDPGGFYSADDYREIIAYAARRHMTVVPEIDTPGHTHAVSLAYPGLCEQPVLSDHIREIVRDHGGALPVNGTAYDGMAVGFSSLKIHDEATYAFLADVLGEVAALTPGPYLHVGGDEALGTDPADFALFMGRVTHLVADLGKIPVTWHEAGAAPGLASATVGQYWGFVTPTDGSDAKTRTFATGGPKVILSPADAVYLDMKFDEASPLGLTWARGVTSAQRAYEWEPAAVIDGIGEADILGVEAPLWTETVRSLADIDALAFPRIAAAAEAAWSPPLGSTPERTWESFRVRAGALGPLWTSMGIGYTPLAGIEWSST